MNPYQRLLSSFELGSRTLRNRIVSTPHATRYDDGGAITDQYVEYNVRKAAGGLGLLMAFGSASVHPASSPSYGAVALWSSKNEAPLVEIAERVQPYGTVLMAQATHLGRRSSSRRSGQVVRAPSDEPEGVNREIPHVMTTAEIREVVKAFADAAARLERCGWDGVEITSFGGHLIEQFFSPRINSRNDEYGGSFDNRMRFAHEVIAAVRERVSARFIVGMRLTGDPRTEVLGLTPEAMTEIAADLDERGGIDVFSVSGGTGATAEAQEASVPTDAFPRGTYNALAGAIRATVRVPVIVAGRLLTADEAERALGLGECDLVGMTRALIADPDLPAKLERGDAERVRPCIALNQECIGRVNLGMPMRCAVNPDVPVAPARESRRDELVVVIGGGPAGLEAARAAAESGCRVRLIERSDSLGGELRLAAAIGDHPDIGPYLSWVVDELQRGSVAVELGTDATVEDVLQHRPDRVVVATGAKSFVPPTARSLGVPVVADVDALTDGSSFTTAKRVLVYDRNAGFRGTSVAFAATALGCAVTLASPLVSVVEDIEPWLRPSVLRRLAHEGVVNASDIAWLDSNGKGEFIYRWSDRPYTVSEFDLIVFAGFRRAQDTLGRALAEGASGVPVERVGDCFAPRRLYEAVIEGARVGVGQPARPAATVRGGAA